MYKIKLNQLLSYVMIFKELEIFVPNRLNGERIFKELQKFGYKNPDFTKMTPCRICLFRNDKYIYWMINLNDHPISIFEII